MKIIPFATFIVSTFFVTATAAEFPDSRRLPPSGWQGHVFKLSQDYPKSLPAKQAPWEQFNFRTQSAQYIDAVWKYVLEGNLAVNWDVQDNHIRTWYHAPWMHAGSAPREFVRGMTKERSSRPRELHPDQTGFIDNWAVGFYNPRGGYTFGRVWGTSGVPDIAKATFANGTVAAKLLFTTATSTQVPYLAGAFEWAADTENDPNNLQTLRLLQVDLAVRDTRNNTRTGWVFGTMVYDGTRPGATPWDRMVPVGLSWGNDPGVTPTQVAAGEATIRESWINPAAASVMQHYGWAGRLNGPVDNAVSSCLSCHGTAQFPAVSVIPPGNGSEQTRLKWFRNIRAGTPFEAGGQSLDYSLQLQVGLRNYFAATPQTNRDGNTPP